MAVENWPVGWFFCKLLSKLERSTEGKNQFDEGLAIYNSLYKVETPKPNILFNISFMTIMTGQLQNLDFFDLFQFGKKYIPSSDSNLFSKLARMKRVCHDTSALVGDFYEKDYLDGFLRVSKMNDKEREEIKKFNREHLEIDNKEFKKLPKTRLRKKI